MTHCGILQELSSLWHPNTKYQALLTSRAASLRSGSSRSGNLVNKIFNAQEELVRKLATALKNGDEKLLMDCIKKGERNLEKIGVVGKKAKNIIAEIEKLGGVGKILGGGGIKEGSGMLLGYLPSKKGLPELTKTNKWRIISIKL